MNLVELLSLIAGLMTMAAPAMQAIKTIRTRNVEGLAVSTYIMLMALGCFAVLIGVQYRVVTMTSLNALGMLFNVAILFLLSRRALFSFFGGLAVLVAITGLVAPWFLTGLITTRWAEPVGFVYGLVAASTFVPQVLMTWKTREVSALSLPNLALMSAGMVIWIGVATVLGNWSLIFWNSILFLCVAELLRMKLVVERSGARTAGVAAPLEPLV